MSTISPGELLTVAGAGDPETIVQGNLQILNRRIFQFLPTYESGAATTTKGPPTADAHILDEFWRDALGAEYVCTVAGTPGSWKQIRPAVCASAPTGIPTGYWICRSDLNFVQYYYDGAAWQVVRFALLKLDATAAPAVTDDSGDGYAIGSRWIDTTNDKEYICLDATVGAAVWKETTAGAAGGEANTASNVGTGTGVYKQKTGVNLEFKTLTAGTGINIAASGASEVLIKTTFAATSRILGRITAGAGDGEELTGANVRTIAGLATTDSPEFAGLNIGHASDTTITRSAAGIIAVEGVDQVNVSAAQTLTNKTLTNPAHTDQTLTDGATVNWDASSGAIATLTLGGNRTMAAPSNLKKGTYILVVKQDATGSRTLTWNAVFKWGAGTAPVLSTAANATDIITFFCDGTNLYGVAQFAFA